MTEPTFLAFDGFAPAELRLLTCYLVRGGQVQQGTTLRAGRDEAPPDVDLLPFARFRTGGTIVVATAGPDRRFYCLSGFHYCAYTTACWATWAATTVA